MDIYSCFFIGLFSSKVVPMSASVLEKLKQMILSDSDVATRAIDTITPRELNAAIVRDYLDKQKAVNADAHRVLEALIASVTHIPKEKMFGDLKRLAQDLLVGINVKNIKNPRSYFYYDEPEPEPDEKERDHRFYICIAGSTKKDCHFKSNMFMALMMLSLCPDLVPNFVDFLCMGKPVHGGEVDNSVGNYVYVDDASFSGAQASETLGHLKQTLGNSMIFLDFPRKLFVLMLYVNPSTKHHVNSRVGVRGTEWITSDVHPVSVDDEFKKQGFVVGEQEKLFMKQFLGGDSTRPLFYTDLKVADYFSINNGFFFNPVIIGSDGKSMEPYEYSLITDCAMASSSYEKFLVSKGLFCPKSVYKSQKWKDFIIEQFELVD